MYPDGLVFGILNSCEQIDDTRVATKLRDLTISWSRYGYHRRMLEGNGINQILDEALALGHRWCLIQACGHLIDEQWYPKHWGRTLFETAVKDWVENTRFFVMGHIIGDSLQGYGLDKQCLLVDLKCYQDFGTPDFDYEATSAGECVRAIAHPFTEPATSPAASPVPQRVKLLAPSDQREWLKPTLSGWNFIQVSLRNGMPLYDLDHIAQGKRLYLGTTTEQDAHKLGNYLGEEISKYASNKDQHSLSPAQRRFLDGIDNQMRNARRGVFVWNLESYDDVRTPPPSFSAPLSTLYCVASGFKPNMMLETLGFDDDTRVVFFDYSANALEIKKILHQEWDGEGYPSFVRYLFRKFPSPQTYYHLWAGLKPDQVDWTDMTLFWETEIAKWGGEHVIKNHWERYKRLRHEYVKCNVLNEYAPLLASMDRRPNAAIWWSNAFFTVYSNWLYTLDERRKSYHKWLESIAAQDPELHIFGSDFNNISVNHVQAGPYLEHFTANGNGYLDPLKKNAIEIRF